MERGMGRVYRPTRQCLRCKGKGCGRCKAGRRQIAVWTIQFSHRGRQYRESSGSTKRADAVRLLKKRMSEIGVGKKVIGAKVEPRTRREKDKEAENASRFYIEHHGRGFGELVRNALAEPTKHRAVRIKNEIV